MAANGSASLPPMQDIWDEQSKPQLSAGPEATVLDREKLSAILNEQDFEYRNEGRANIVFAIGTSPAASQQQQPWLFGETLLRVPKKIANITPCDYETLQHFHEDVVKPKVGRQHVVPQVLVDISERTADVLNEKRAAHPHRNKKHAAGMVQAGPAMLVQDMGPSENRFVTEFKPKWLHQSPLAPPDATRCRSCAREAFRNSQRETKHLDIAPALRLGVVSPTPSPLPGPPVCPLGLLHAEESVFQRTIERLVPAWPASRRKRLGAGLRASDVLETLRRLQMEGDPEMDGRGTLYINPEDAAFGLAMTLRDCSCFVMVPGDDDPDGKVVIKLGDLDKKNSEEKHSYWQKMHEDLVHGGWYRGEERPPIETACVLWRDECIAKGRHEDIPPAFRTKQ